MGSSLLMKVIQPCHWVAPTGLHDSRAIAGRAVDGPHGMVLGQGGVGSDHMPGASQDMQTRQVG
jgi:hypothetical protein